MRFLFSLFLAATLGLASDGRAKAFSQEHEHERETDLGHGAGFELSALALASFGVKVKKLAGPGPYECPSEARVYTGEEVNLFRRREGRWERVDFTEIKTNGGVITVRSPSLTSGDEIATLGLGFLRIAEIAASGEAPAGHSH